MMNKPRVDTAAIFWFIGFVVVSICFVFIKKIKKDMRRIHQLSMQIVPAVLVAEEPYVPDLPMVQ